MSSRKVQQSQNKKNLNDTSASIEQLKHTQLLLNSSADQLMNLSNEVFNTTNSNNGFVGGHAKKSTKSRQQTQQLNKPI